MLVHHDGTKNTVAETVLNCPLSFVPLIPGDKVQHLIYKTVGELFFDELCDRAIALVRPPQL